jgi:hypothetical protein
MKNIEKLQKNELEELLKDLRLYKDLVKKVWSRWKKIFHNIFNETNEYSVEYYWDLDESYVFKKSKKVYKKLFDIEVDESDIKLIKKDSLKWGMRIYFNDKLVDLSFLKFYNLLK